MIWKCFNAVLMTFCFVQSSNLPEGYEKLINKAKFHETRQEWSEAMEIYERISMKENLVKLHDFLPSIFLRQGNILLNLNQMEAALEKYRYALNHRKNYFEAELNSAIVYRKMEKRQESVNHIQQAIRIRPDSPLPYQLLGELYSSTFQYQASLNAYYKALSLDENNSDLMVNAASMLDEIGNKTAAMDLYERALRSNPNHSIAFCNLLISKRTSCNWENLERFHDRLQSLISTSLNPQCIHPFHSIMFPLKSKTLLSIASYFANEKKNLAIPSLRKPRKRSGWMKRLRVGYLSSDFRESPTGYLIRSIFRYHKTETFEIFCFSTMHVKHSSIQHHIKNSVEHFFDLTSLSSYDKAKFIRSKKIDILIELNGWVQGENLQVLAWRSAPIQASFLAFPGSTGASFIDYFVTDRFSTPPSLNSHDFVEKPWFMPKFYHYQVNDYQFFSSVSLSKPLTWTNVQQTELNDLKFSNSFVYMNFNSLYKLEPLTMYLWSNIQRRTRISSRLWLASSHPYTNQHLREEWEALGHTSNHSLIITTRWDRTEHLKRCSQGNLFLDSLVINAHSTAADVLWSRVPVLSVPGRKLSNRLSSSLVKTMDLRTELIVYSIKEYEDLAIEISNSEKPFIYNNIRNKVRAEYVDLLYHDLTAFMYIQLIRQRKLSMLFNTEKWIQQFENGLLGIQELRNLLRKKKKKQVMLFPTSIIQT